MEIPRHITRHDVARLRARVRALESGIDLGAVRVAPRVWVVPSVTAAGESHVVCRRRGAWSCDCRASEFGRYCTHIAAVEVLLERRATAHQQTGAMVN